MLACRSLTLRQPNRWQPGCAATATVSRAALPHQPPEPRTQCRRGTGGYPQQQPPAEHAPPLPAVTLPFHPFPAAGHACIAFCVADGGDDTIDAGGSAALRALRGAPVTSLICGLNYAYTARDVPAAALAGWDALTHLEFSHARLSGSLRHVCQLAQLRRLELDGREISGGWRQLAALARLQHLDLAECHAQQVVDSLTALEALTHLALSGFEQRASSWQNLARLTRLRYLSLAADTVREAPQHLRGLQLLEHLRLMPDLPEVPHHPSVLTSLTCLNLSDNEELAGGWQHVLPLRRLRRLVLTLSGVELIPREFSEMTGLTALLLNHACVWVGFEHLRPLQQLQELDLSAAEIAAVPEDLSALTALTCLQLRFVRDLEDCQHLTALTLLRNLSMQFCYLEQVPSALSALTALTFLDLSANRFLGGWQYLAPLAHLQCLNLASCLSTHIPSVLSTLTALTSLRVSSAGNNAIVGGWEHLQPLTLLQDCRLPDNWRP